jgi:prophage regulatory protein
MAERFLKRTEVESRTRLSRSTIYAWMDKGEFPRPVALGARLVGWRESDIEAWMASRQVKAA